MTDLRTTFPTRPESTPAFPKARLRSPLGAWPVLLPALAITGVVVAATGRMRSWPYQEWVQTSAEFHQQNVFTAPIAAAAATYFAGRLLPPSRVFALPSAARAGRQTVAQHLGLLIGVFVAAYLLGLLPLVVVTVSDAEHGGPDIGAMLTGVLGLALATAVGYLVGAVTRTALTAPLSFVLLFGAAVVGSSGDTFSSLAPVLYITPVLGSVQSTPFVVYRLAFLTVCAIAVVWTAVGLLRRHRVSGRFRGAAALLPLLLPAVLAVPPLLSKPALFAYEAEVPQVCRAAGGVEYCVHGGHRSRLDLLVAATDAAVQRYGRPAPFTRVYDEALRGRPVDGTDEWRPEAPDTVLWIPIQPQNPTETRPVQAVYVLSGSGACRRLGDAADPESVRLADDLGGWLAGTVRSHNAFAGLPDSAVRQWIAANVDRIAGCTLTPESLPSR
ncbi:hypothetical protein FHS29_005062 [Saccharothrix tamanrassetensis]|uniref:Uncharacterized protein n=1 Tax=Saccharothrix tamanrassetensis TaxID=1051531 RepID=A0A841CQ24_9PSEU|nr:hypothetical protein [Saccharothrix tamanrassetensis]MBB5958454.1 hypothetical protein [Saccharothrix tamanrassetensis]